MGPNQKAELRSGKKGVEQFASPRCTATPQVCDDLNKLIKKSLKLVINSPQFGGDGDNDKRIEPFVEP